MIRKEILVVDGYNMIGSWPELTKLKTRDLLADARDSLLHTLSEYQRYEGLKIIVVFDAQFVPGITQQFSQYGLEVVFTNEGVTADSYIEALSGKLMTPFTQVTVATSDQAEQWTIFSRGALRIAAPELAREITRVKKAIKIDTSRDYNVLNQRNRPWNPSQMEKLAALRDELSQPTKGGKANDKT